MRFLTRLAVCILLVHLGLIVWTNRALFTQRFDELYWKDKYEHSQWKLPLSQRTIGDDGLYLYEGYRLSDGADPTLLNAEVPPLGKYIIGASVRVFQNGHIFGILTYAAVLCVFFLLARQLLSSTAHAVLLTALLALDPLLTSQATLTMLDSLQLLFLLLFLLLLAKRAHPATLGVVVGLFAETKFGILAPILLGIGGFALWKEHKKIKPLLLFFFAAALSYVLPYLRFFTLGHSPLDWLKVQKWIVAFYAHGNLTPTMGAAAAALLWGHTQNIFSRLWEPILEWSPVWSVVTIASFGALFFKRTPAQGQHARSAWTYVAACAILIFLFFLVIPFWTRYLLLLLPLLYLGFGALVHKHIHRRAGVALFGVLLAINAFSSLRILFPTPERTVGQFVYEWEHGFFQDMYETTTNEVKLQTTREAFRKVGLTAYHGGEIESVEIAIGQARWSHTQTRQEVPITITYITRNLGAFTEARLLPVVREDGRWRIPWQWPLLISGFTESARLTTVINPARRGSIVGSDNKPLAEDTSGYLVWVTPGEIDKTHEEELLATLETLFGGRMPKVALHQRIVGNSLPHLAIPIGVLPYPKTDPNVAILLAMPGASLTDALARVTHPNNVVDIGELKNSAFSECCSYLYTTTTYDGASGGEKERNAELKGYNGGRLVLMNKDGGTIRIILEKEKLDGTNVRL